MPKSALLLFGAFTLPFFLGCGRGSSSIVPESAPPMVSVTLVDGPSPALKAIRLRIEKVEIHTSATAGESGWQTLGEPKKTVDLLSLRNGVVDTLVPGTILGPGQYQQLRLLLGTSNEVVLGDDSVQPLEVPSGLKTGIKVPLSFETLPGTRKDVFIDFDGNRSIQVHTTGANGRYILRPVVRAVDRTVSGGVSGILTGPSGPLGNVLVIGQTPDAGGRLQVLRTVPTKADGSFLLDLLPLNVPVTLAALPTGMAPKASDPLTLTLALPTATWTTSFLAATGQGTLSGTVTPAPTTAQSDVAEILAQLVAGSASRWVVVATTPVLVGTTATFQATLPPGTYQVQVRRTTLGTDGTATSVLSPLSATTTLVGSQTVAVTVAF